MARTRTRKWDPAEHLRNDADVLEYLQAALEDGDPAVVAAVLGDIARAKGMADIARQAGVGRESLYKSLSAGGNPEFATVMNVLKALGLRLHAAAEPAPPTYKVDRRRDRLRTRAVGHRSST
ncbi:MAG TPA: addiction module antidote protein [Burkholderiales bacterium]|jgi:probable addiction module antidote protein|nr:addiction module antidote protein [Burkholderiales bacterium]